MKKTYINPQMEVHEMKYTNCLMAGSPGLPGSTDATSGNLSRDMLFDFDEE